MTDAKAPDNGVKCHSCGCTDVVIYDVEYSPDSNGGSLLLFASCCKEDCNAGSVIAVRDFTGESYPDTESDDLDEEDKVTSEPEEPDA